MKITRLSPIRKELKAIRELESNLKSKDKEVVDLRQQLSKLQSMEATHSSLFKRLSDWWNRPIEPDKKPFWTYVITIIGTLATVAGILVTYRLGQQAQIATAQLGQAEQKATAIRGEKTVIQNELGTANLAAVSEDHNKRARAYLLLASLATRIEPGAADEFNETNYPLFLPVSDQLRFALKTETDSKDTERVCGTILKGFSLMSLFVKDRDKSHGKTTNHDAMLLELIGRLADDNRAAKANFLQAIAHWCDSYITKNLTLKKDDRTRIKKLAKELAQKVVFCTNANDNQNVLEQLLIEGDYQYTGATPAGDPDQKLTTAVTQMKHSRDALATMLKALSPPEGFSKQALKEYRDNLNDAEDVEEAKEGDVDITKKRVDTAKKKLKNTKELVDSPANNEAKKNAENELQSANDALKNANDVLSADTKKLKSAEDKFRDATKQIRTDFSPKGRLERDDIDITQCFLAGADLSEVNLQGVDFGFVYLQGANLYNAGLQGAVLGSAYITGTNFWKTELQGASLVKVNVSNIKKGTISGFYEAKLQGADLSGAHLESTNFFWAELETATLKDAHLEGANMTNTYLQGTDLSELHTNETTRFEWKGNDGDGLPRKESLSKALNRPKTIPLYKSRQTPIPLQKQPKLK